VLGLVFDAMGAAVFTVYRFMLFCRPGTQNSSLFYSTQQNSFSMEKIEWCGYQMMKKFEDRCHHFDRILSCDRQMDRHLEDGIVCAMHSVAQ